MRKIIITLTLLLSTTTFAQEKIFQLNKPMNCSSAQSLMEYLFKQLGEVPVWVGKESASGSYISIVMNKEKGTWTLIQYDAVTGCVLGAGQSDGTI
jgi:hypothetical protein